MTFSNPLWSSAKGETPLDRRVQEEVAVQLDLKRQRRDHVFSQSIHCSPLDSSICAAKNTVLTLLFQLEQLETSFPRYMRVLGVHWAESFSFFETPELLRGSENVTRALIHNVVGRKRVIYQIWVNYLFKEVWLLSCEIYICQIRQLMHSLWVALDGFLSNCGGVVGNKQWE